MSTRQMRSNRPTSSAGRRAVLAVAVAVAGLGVGSSLAEATDEPATTEPATSETTTTGSTTTEATSGENLVIELVVEPPPEEPSPADDPTSDEPVPEPEPAATPPEPLPATTASPSESALTVDVVVETVDAVVSGPGEDRTDPAQAETSEEASMPVGQPSTFADTPTEPAEAAALRDDDSQATAPATDQHDGGHDDDVDGHDDGHDDDGHNDGHGGNGSGGGGSGGGGSGPGEGNPYRMTFTVDWQDADGSPIAVLEDVLPQGWQALFELVAAGSTRGYGPTWARCTYPDGSDVLVCEFDNSGHPGGDDGMVVPGSPKATYTVSVVWQLPDWIIDGANDGPYSARDLCPRGGGHDGGGDVGGGDDGGGHDGGTGHDGGSGHDGSDTSHDHVADAANGGHGGRTFGCEHTVLIRQLLVEPEPESTEPAVPGEPMESPEPTAPRRPPSRDEVAPAALPPAVASVATATTRPTLPATGAQATVILVVGAALSAIGAGLVGMSRRRPGTTPGTQVLTELDGPTGGSGRGAPSLRP